MSVKELVLEAFKNKETGLTKNPSLLRKKNPQLYGIHDAAIREVLNNELPTYNRNGPLKRVKKYVRYKADYVGQILHCDLMFLNSARNTNQAIEIDDKKYVLVIVDTLSKYVWIYPIESKKSYMVSYLIHKTVEEIKENYYDGAPVAVFKILTDAGKEFNTKLIEEKEGIKHIISKNPRGAALSESAILKIRTKIKYLDKNIRKLSLEDLNSIVSNLNLESGAAEIMNKTVFPEPELVERKKVKESFKQGDFVRVRTEKKLFEKKSSLDNYGEKILIVLDDQFDTRNQLIRYRIGSLDGQLISEKLWYEEELKLIPKSFVLKEEIEKHKNFTKEEIKNLFLVK